MCLRSVFWPHCFLLPTPWQSLGVWMEQINAPMTTLGADVPQDPFLTRLTLNSICGRKIGASSESGLSDWMRIRCVTCLAASRFHLNQIHPRNKRISSLCSNQFRELLLHQTAACKEEEDSFSPGLPVVDHGYVTGRDSQKQEQVRDTVRKLRHRIT